MGDIYIMYSGLELNMFNGFVFMIYQIIIGMEISKYIKRISFICYRYIGVKMFMKMYEFLSFQYVSNLGIFVILCFVLQVCEEFLGFELQQGLLSIYLGEYLMLCDCFLLINELFRWFDLFLLFKNDNDKIFNFVGY